MLLAAGGVRAAGDGTPLGNFRHDRWSLEDGAPGRINAITQSHDGFLWIGSVEGLVRFDGVAFETIELAPETGEHLVVSQLHASRNGEIWIGLARGRGVRIWRAGRVIDPHMPDPAREVNDIAEDAAGGIWIVAGGRSEATLMRYARGRWRSYGPADGLPREPVWAVMFARDGSQWVVCDSTIVVRRPGGTRFEATGIAVTPRASLAQDPQGAIWLADTRGTWRIAPGRPALVYPRPGSVGGARMLFDRDGDLWETTWNDGVVRIRAPGRALVRRGGDEAPRIAAFTSTAGLTSEQTHALFQDREGNIWVGSELGLDMLRPAAIVVEPAIPANPPTSYRMAAARDGTVWIADTHALYAIAPGGAPRRVLATRSPAEALCADDAAGVWLIESGRVVHVSGARRQVIVRRGGAKAMGCAEDAGGSLWLPALDHGLLRWRDGMWSRWPGAEVARPGNVLRGADGRAVILLRAGTARIAGAPFATLSDADSRVGTVEGLLGGDGGMLVSGAQGLQAPGRGVLPAGLYPWAASLNGFVETAAGETWAIGDAGIVRLPTAALQRALARPGSPIAARVFDFRDGLDSFVQKAPGAQIVAGGDGRIWALTRRNVVRIDPAALRRNPLPPTVVIEHVTAGDRPFDALPGLHLPAGTTHMTIAYTATSLTVPGRVRFRYRLGGGAWTDAGTTRSAAFNDLGPGRYTFQVLAANEDGVWNTTGQTLTLSIDRTFYQTWWFRVLAAEAVLALGYLAYAARVRYLGGRIRERLAERMAERERIARELHDTLIQSVQGLIMRFQAVADRLGDDPEAQAILVPALDRAEEMLVEGRDRVKGLRRLEDRHLERELRHLLDGQTFDEPVALSLTTNGPVRAVAPEILDDIVTIVSEALCNAARHARPTEVEVRVDYGGRALIVLVVDNGVGLPADVHLSGARAGHFGLVGMRERARRIGARLSIESSAGLGTLVRLVVPARRAYVV